MSTKCNIGGTVCYFTSAVVAVLDNDALLRIPVKHFDAALEGTLQPAFSGLPAGTVEVRLGIMSLFRESTDRRYRVSRDNCHYVVERFVNHRLDLDEHNRRFNSASPGTRWEPDALLQNRIEQAALGLCSRTPRARVVIDDAGKDDPATLIATTLRILAHPTLSNPDKLRMVHAALEAGTSRHNP